MSLTYSPGGGRGGARGMTISTPRAVSYRRPGHASLIFFNSRSESFRKFQGL